MRDVPNSKLKLDGSFFLRLDLVGVVIGPKTACASSALPTLSGLNVRNFSREHRQADVLRWLTFRVVLGIGHGWLLVP
jgi:hypothetical protein